MTLGTTRTSGGKERDASSTQSSGAASAPWRTPLNDTPCGTRTYRNGGVTNMCVSTHGEGSAGLAGGILPVAKQKGTFQTLGT